MTKTLSQSSDYIRTTNIAFVEQHLDVRGRSGNEWDIVCVFHKERNASMRVNVAKGLFFCHGCHEKGGMAKLARQVGVRYSFDQTEAALATMHSKLQKLKEVRGEKTPAYKPESDLTRYLLPTGYWTDPRPQGRGFTGEMVELFDLGYDPLQDVAIIPIRDHVGRLLGYTRRFLDPKADVRYKDPKGFSKATHLFGSWLADQHESGTVVVVEGPLDAVKVWQAGYVGVAQYGSYLTEEQIKILKKMGTVTVVLMYDNDQGGKRSTNYALGFTWHNGKRVYEPEHDLRYHFIVKQVPWSTYVEKDAGDMTEAQINNCICKARLLV